MDVDLLRPGTVPISPETVLWFEFLIDQDLLLKHLQKQQPDPSAIELISKFTVVNLDSESFRRSELENGEPRYIGETVFEAQPKYSLKSLALKILTLKVAAFIKWNLDQLRSMLYKTQLTLMQDLIYFTNDQQHIDLPDLHDVDISTASPPLIFALILYHRWIITTTVNRIVFNGQARIYGNGDILTMSESIICTPDYVHKSSLFLVKALNLPEVPNVLTYDCFKSLTEHCNTVQHDWTSSLPLSKEEFHAQIHYDLAAFYFFREDYEQASANFVNCAKLCKALKENGTEVWGYLNVDEENLEGYLLGCNAPGDTKKNLLHQLHISVANQYTGILQVLQQDNLYREIPISYRTNLELDIHGAMCSGKFTVARDLLPKIQALNAVRCILDKKPAYQYDVNTNNLDTFIWALTPVLKTCNINDIEQLKTFLLQVMLKNDSELTKKMLSQSAMSSIFIKTEIDALTLKSANEDSVPEFLTSSGWETPNFKVKRNTRLEIRSLEQQIISCYNAQELRELLLKLTSKNPSRPAWRINPCWEWPIPLQSVLVTMPKGFLQDFSFILLAKARELMFSKDWNGSVELLKVLESEIQTGNGVFISKLSRLISWEVLLVQINNLLEEWPAPNIDTKILAEACETCLQTGESVLPRIEIMEHCALCLLNLARWDFLSAFEKRWSYFEIAAAITAACQDLVKFKGNKKVSKDLWDLVLPIFGVSPSQSKRTSSGAASVIQRDSPIGNTKATLLSFFSRLRDATVLAVVISMLARLFNVLRDESSLELNVEYIILWPAVVSNASSYNARAVSEVLSQVVMQALHYYPTNVSWLRLMGDINYVNGHHETALNYYLKSLVITTDNFNLPVRNDDHVFKRMIKSCSSLGCHTQAAVLCQFLDEPDYSFAFRSLADQKSCSDAMDSYYHCFWDVNILEYLVHLHHKKGEFQRRKRAIQVLGLLELNSNNNEEIQREASNLRKSVFLRSLCKQYLQ